MRRRPNPSGIWSDVASGIRDIVIRRPQRLLPALAVFPDLLADLIQDFRLLFAVQIPREPPQRHTDHVAVVQL